MGIFPASWIVLLDSELALQAIRSRCNERVVIAMRVASAEGLVFPDKKGENSYDATIAGESSSHHDDPDVHIDVVDSPVASRGRKFYQQRNLVSDGSMTAEHTDANLVNPWGIVFNPNGFVWVADNGTGVSTL